VHSPLKVSSPAARTVCGGRSVRSLSRRLSLLAGFLFATTTSLSAALSDICRDITGCNRWLLVGGGMRAVGCLLGSATSGVWPQVRVEASALCVCCLLRPVSFGVWMRRASLNSSCGALSGRGNWLGFDRCSDVHCRDRPATVRGRLVVFYQLGIVVVFLARCTSTC